MKCKNKSVLVEGVEYNSFNDMICNKGLDVIITNDEIGKTISINNGRVQFTIPFESIERYLR